MGSDDEKFLKKRKVEKKKKKEKSSGSKGFEWKLKPKNNLDSDDEEARKKERLIELEKARERRRQRELEQRQREDERGLLQRQNDFKAFSEWASQEDQFILQQAKLRAEIRVKEGRAKPIDILYKNLNGDSDFDVLQDKPYKILDQLEISQLQELIPEIEMYCQIDSEEHRPFWRSLIALCKERIEQFRSRQKGHGVHRNITQDIAAKFKNKSASELELLVDQISKKLRTESAIDVEYWEDLLKIVKIRLAKTQLKEFHEKIIEMKNQPTVEIPKEKLLERSKKSKNQEEHNNEKKEINSDNNDTHNTNTPSEKKDINSSTTPISEVEKRKRALEEEALRLETEHESTSSINLKEQELLKREQATPLRADEELFSNLVPISKAYAWQDLYNPITPKFYNRVVMNYDWSKYNQTHYDSENPPPKRVVAYKFNIFYPELIDPSKTPRYFVKKDPNDPDSYILWFSGGPPYADIAFRIVDGEWEYSSKHGFKCTFERGVLHLWFHLKRVRYKR